MKSSRSGIRTVLCSKIGSDSIQWFCRLISQHVRARYAYSNVAPNAFKRRGGAATNVRVVSVEIRCVCDSQTIQHIVRQKKCAFK